MKILAIGDVTSPRAAEYLSRSLWSFRKKENIDLVIVNAENASFITGASAEIFDKLLYGGADCITGGNHTMRNRSVYNYLDESDKVIRPINFGDSVPGRGYTILDAAGRRVMVINAMGTVHIEPVLNSPYEYIDKALLSERNNYDYAVLDIHAEATGEKLAIGYNYDGRINIVFGTHTHVPTADCRILPEGTGYVTDVGMCGEDGGVLGIDKDSVIVSMRTHMPPRFAPAGGETKADGVIFTLDKKSGRVTNIERVKI